MHSSKKGNQWYFGMKAHIGADAESGLVHTVRGTPGHVSDIAEGNTLLHGDESVAFGDAGYQGIEKRADATPPSSTLPPRFSLISKGGLHMNQSLSRGFLDFFVV